MVARTCVIASAVAKTSALVGLAMRSAQRFAIFVKICIAVAPMALARGGASCVPPAIDTCAPSSRSSSHTGATQFGSFALSFLGLKAGRFGALARRCAA